MIRESIICSITNHTLLVNKFPLSSVRDSSPCLWSTNTLATASASTIYHQQDTTIFLPHCFYDEVPHSVHNSEVVISLCNITAWNHNFSRALLITNFLPQQRNIHRHGFSSPTPCPGWPSQTHLHPPQAAILARRL